MWLVNEELKVLRHANYAYGGGYAALMEPRQEADSLIIQSKVKS